MENSLHFVCTHYFLPLHPNTTSHAMQTHPFYCTICHRNTSILLYYISCHTNTSMLLYHIMPCNTSILLFATASCLMSWLFLLQVQFSEFGESEIFFVVKMFCSSWRCEQNKVELLPYIRGHIQIIIMMQNSVQEKKCVIDIACTLQK